MTYLELVNTLLLLLRASNAKISAPLTSLENLEGVNYEAAAWIAMANRDLQTHRRDWLFMRSSGSVIAPAGTRVLNIRASITDLADIIPSTGDNDGRFITTWTDPTSAEIKCFYIPWEAWRGSVFDRRPVSQSSNPIRFTVRPDDQLEFDPTISEATNLVFDYRRRVTNLQAATDTSVVPEEFHMAIVHWAIYRYYCLTRDATQEYRAKAKIEYDREMQRLYNAQIPEVTIGGGIP